MSLSQEVKNEILAKEMYLIHVLWKKVFETFNHAKIHIHMYFIMDLA